MLLQLTNVDMNRSPVVIDSDDIDMLVEGQIQGTVIITKSQNEINVVESVEQVEEMIAEAKSGNTSPDNR